MIEITRNTRIYVHYSVIYKGISLGGKKCMTQNTNLHSGYSTRYITIKIYNIGTCPVVKTPCFHWGGMGWIPGWGTKIPACHVVWPKRKKEREKERKKERKLQYYVMWGEKAGYGTSLSITATALENKTYTYIHTTLKQWLPLVTRMMIIIFFFILIYKTYSLQRVNCAFFN